MKVEPVFFSKLPQDIKPTWDHLLSRSFRPNFQYDFEYMLAWTEHLREQWSPFLLLVKEGDTVKGIVPLMYMDEKRRGVLPYRRIRFLGSTRTDFSTVLAESRDMAEVINASLNWLFSGNLRWELLILDDLMEGNPAVEALRAWLEASSVEYSIDEGKYYFVDLDRPWEEVWQETSKKAVRRSINLARNRITKAGNWEMIIDPEWDMEKIVAEASPMHIERQEELDRDSFYMDPDSIAFLQKIFKHNRERGIFKSCWLLFEDHYIAYMLGFEKDNVYYAWNMAFNPDYASFFPSKLLLFELIKDCHNKKLTEFSFMRGEGEYKAKWTKHYRVNYRFNIKNTQSLYGKTISLLEKTLK